MLKHHPDLCLHLHIVFPCPAGGVGVCVRVADPRLLSTHPAAPATTLVCVSEEHEQVEVLPPRPAGQGLRQQVDGGMDTRNLQGVRPTRASSGGMATQI